MSPLSQPIMDLKAVLVLCTTLCLLNQTNFISYTFSLGCVFLTFLIVVPLNSLQLTYLFQLKPCKHHYLLYLTIAQKDIYYF